MSALRKKLHSQSGASMLMALLLMLVALMVSAVIIAAAVSAATTIREERAQEQAYLTVSSAAELLRDEINRGGCDSTTTVTAYYTNKSCTGTAYKTKECSRSSKGKNTNETKPDSIFYSIIEEGMNQVDTYAGSTFNRTYTFTAGDLADVKAEFFIKAASERSAAYNLTVWFSTGEDGKDPCRMCLTANAYKLDGEPSITDASYTETYYGGLYSRTYERWMKVETSGLEWKNPTIQKEVASQ